MTRRERLRTRTWRGLALTIVSTILLAFLFHGFDSDQFPVGWLHNEHGLYESASVMLLLGAAFACILAAREEWRRRHRRFLILLAIIFLTAVLRELDLHIVLNPEYIGAIGVRYRIDWWLDPEVSTLLKLGWGAVGAGLVWLVLWAAAPTPRLIWNFIRKGHPSVHMGIVCIVGYLIGYVFDDLLRHSTIMSHEMKLTWEEGAEAIGAAGAFLGTITLFPPSRRH